MKSAFKVYMLCGAYSERAGGAVTETFSELFGNISAANKEDLFRLISNEAVKTFRTVRDFETLRNTGRTLGDMGLGTLGKALGDLGTVLMAYPPGTITGAEMFMAGRSMSYLASRMGMTIAEATQFLKLGEMAPWIIKEAEAAVRVEQQLATVGTVNSTSSEFNWLLPNGKGVLATLDEEGRLATAIEAGAGSPVSGTDMFRAALGHFGDKVKAIEGNWFYGDNLAQVNELTARGMSIELAISETWTARQAANFGFSVPRLATAPGGTPGHYTGISVIFERRK
jgi:hypothetical protein